MRSSYWSSDVCSSDLLLPAAVQIGFHLVEANAITPLVLGRRLTMNPLLILVSLSFWGWVWGPPCALLAVPLLIIIQTVLQAAGKPEHSEEPRVGTEGCRSSKSQVAPYHSPKNQ